MKLFSDLSAYVDSELVGAVVAASLTVFMETAGNPFGDVVELNGSKKKSLYGPYPKELVPGSVLTGRPGDKPHLLANPRPGQSFDPFMGVRTLNTEGTIEVEASGAVTLGDTVIAADDGKVTVASGAGTIIGQALVGATDGGVVELLPYGYGHTQS